MTAVKTTLLCLFAICAVVTCSDSNTGPTLVTEPAGAAHYYIDNQSTVDLKVSYATMGYQTDSLKTIPADTSVKVFEDGIFGVNPTPSISFSRILFYDLSADTSEPAFTINQVKDDKWNIIDRKGFEDSEYGLTIYELVVTDEEIK